MKRYLLRINEVLIAVDRKSNNKLIIEVLCVNLSEEFF